jgi:hypothetical protein
MCANGLSQLVEAPALFGNVVIQFHESILA